MKRKSHSEAVGRVHAEEIKQLRWQGLTLREIGEKYGVTRERVRQILVDSAGWKATPIFDWVEELFVRETFTRAGKCQPGNRRNLPWVIQHQHGTYLRYNAGCRCEPCGKAARAKVEKSLNKTAANMKPGDGHPKHGTAYGYRMLKCRCDLCRAAGRAADLEYRKKRIKRGWYNKELCGKTMTNYALGCRCEPCMERMRAKGREAYANKMAKGKTGVI